MKKNHVSYKTNLSRVIILILLFTALSPALQFSRLQSIANDTDTFSDERILICTASGYRYISLSDYKNGDFPDDYNQKIKCPVCIVNMVLGDKTLISPLEVEITFPLLAINYYSSNAETHISLTRIWRFNSRAPPLYS